MLNKEDIKTLFKVQVILEGYNKHGILEKYNKIMEKLLKNNK